MITLIDDNLAIVRAKPNAVITIGRILAPDNSRELTLEGTVIAVGPGLLNKRGVRIPVEVQVGDYVFFKNYEGNDVKAEGQDLLIIREVYVVAKAWPFQQADFKNGPGRCYPRDLFDKQLTKP